MFDMIIKQTNLVSMNYEMFQNTIGRYDNIKYLTNYIKHLKF